MRNCCFVCLVILAVSFSGSAQFMELNFNCNLFDASNCSPFVNTTARCARGSTMADDWQASHGSPHIVSGTPSTGNSRWAAFRAHESNGTFLGEGLFIPYNFVDGRRYKLEIFAKRVGNQSGGRLRFQAVNALTAGGQTTCGEAALPFVWEKEDIYVLSHSQGISEYRENFVSPEFIPTRNYSQLWIYLEEIYLGMSSEYQIEYLTVQETVDQLPSSSGIPNKPSMSDAFAVSHDQILLKWKDNSNNELGFQIAWCGVSPCPPLAQWPRINVPANTTRYLHTGLDPLTQYIYRVAAVWREFPWSSYSYEWDYSKPAEVTMEDICFDDVVYDAQSTIRYTTKAINSIETGNGFAVTIVYPVTFSAGGQVILKAPTTIPSGRNFKAMIAPCTTAANSSSSMSSSESLLTDPVISLENEITIYPNPSKDYVAVYFKKSGNQDGYLQLRDKTSNAIYVKRLSAEDTEVRLDVRLLPNDTYYLHVVRGKKEAIKKLIVER